MMWTIVQRAILVLFVGSMPAFAMADVTAIGENGFHIRIDCAIEGKSANEVFQKLTGNWGDWWSGSHTYSGHASRLSIDENHDGLVERLPDGGFVRHMQIVFWQPGKTLRMVGGLGPLQAMGVSGAMTISLREKEGQTQLQLEYTVSGFSPTGFENIARAVDSVLVQQLDRFKRYCKTGSPESADSSGRRLVDVVVELSCGECQFGLEGDGCDLAIRIDGTAMYVDGSGIDDHGDAHAADGLCNAIRRARVTGTIQKGRFVAEEIELLDR